MAHGAVVVCNVSRSSVGAARTQFPHVRHIEITAPHAVLRARLVARGRESDADITNRLSRQSLRPELSTPDVVINNAGRIGDAARAFVRTLETLID